MQERILRSADRLFYAHGIQAIGVDTIAADVGISKRTLYNHFPSKADLIRAYLERWSQPPASTELPPAERILAEFDRLERTFSQPSYRGCPFINAVAEAAEPADELTRLAIDFKKARRRWFASCLAELGVPDPERLATQMMLLVDGAVATMLVQGDASIARAARDAAEVLLTAAGVAARRPRVSHGEA
ncbi:TetR family transcriptional regulator [Roseomonas terrae]|uniref:TetR family transcriptional regulator n=2 Tax=Neoroseomonas terrae TaxID=424799 RepID=A0ABS5EC58_9PROT|nr:TetR family transcriptional regulator [Neoroseomonas terrae]